MAIVSTRMAAEKSRPIFQFIVSRHHGTQRDESGNQNADSGQMLQKTQRSQRESKKNPQDDSYRRARQWWCQSESKSH